MYQEDSRTKIQDSLQKELQSPQFLRKFNRFKKTQPKLVQFNTPAELVEFFSSNEIVHQRRICLRHDFVCLRNDNEEKFNLCNQWLYSLVSNYQNKPERKPWLMTLLLVISWKQMECTYYRFGYEALKQINPFDPFAPVYESYIDAFLSLKQKTVCKFALHLKDRAEYLIRKELKECKRFQGEPTTDVPTFQSLPWSFEIEQMISEWTSKRILNLKQSKLVIYRVIYEYTYNELEGKFKASANALKLRFHRAIKKLKAYLKGKYFGGNGIFMTQNRV
jgi:hypothetical protein